MGQYDLVVGDDLGDDFGDDMAGDDMAGADLLLGADLVVGGRGGKRKIRPQRIQPVSQTQFLDFPFGLDGVAVALSATETLAARPQRIFQTERLVVASTISANFLIGDLVVGRDSMKVNSGFTAAEVFAQTGVGVSLRGFIARPGIDINITVKNLLTSAAPFYGSVIGPVLV